LCDIKDRAVFDLDGPTRCERPFVFIAAGLSERHGVDPILALRTAWKGEFYNLVERKLIFGHHFWLSVYDDPYFSLATVLLVIAHLTTFFLPIVVRIAASLASDLVVSVGPWLMALAK
jgi:hypothetical protein